MSTQAQIHLIVSMILLATSTALTVFAFVTWFDISLPRWVAILVAPIAAWQTALAIRQVYLLTQNLK